MFFKIISTQKTKYAAYRCIIVFKLLFLKMPDKSYNAKVLLFGEYTIIHGANALAIPVTQFSGKWAFANDSQATILNKELIAFADYVEQLYKNELVFYDLDLKTFRQEIGKGLYFQSTIPHGYGAGSSGALCAAVYERFSQYKIGVIENIDLYDLRIKLALLEKYFHGSSSGIDPLISLINKPVLINQSNNSIVRLPASGHSNRAVFLLDTGIKRKTEPLVRLFLEKYKNDFFVTICKERLTNFNENAIQCFLQAQWQELFNTVHQISRIQLEHFNEMIPEGFLSVWKEGLERELYRLKLCGAGGGGFILGFTNDLEKTIAAFPNNRITSIYRF